MQDQTSPRDAAAGLDQLERVVLHLLLDSGSPGILSEREVAEAIGSEAHAAHALVQLHSAGLIHRLEEFVFPTRPAVRFWQLEEGAGG
jgi:predicted transcriptional regulator